MTRIVPETYATKDWPRKVAQADESRRKEIAALSSRVATLETLAFETVTFTPTTAPGSPVAGMTYFDSVTLKLRCHDGTNWNDLW